MRNVILVLFLFPFNSLAQDYLSINSDFIVSAPADGVDQRGADFLVGGGIGYERQFHRHWRVGLNASVLSNQFSMTGVEAVFIYDDQGNVIGREELGEVERDYKYWFLHNQLFIHRTLLNVSSNLQIFVSAGVNLDGLFSKRISYISNADAQEVILKGDNAIGYGPQIGVGVRWQILQRSALSLQSSYRYLRYAGGKYDDLSSFPIAISYSFRL